ncbi:hypothetical protein, partial [Vallitalea sediminicola]
MKKWKRLYFEKPFQVTSFTHALPHVNNIPPESLFCELIKLPQFHFFGLCFGSLESTRRDSMHRCSCDAVFCCPPKK